MLKRAIVVGMISLLSLTATVNSNEIADHTPSTHPTFEQLDKKAKREVECLANNIYFEANNQSLKGKVAVGFVTMNRVQSGKYPSTVCGVVKQQINEVCQFSWWCDPAARAKAVANRFIGAEKHLYDNIRAIATWVYFNHSSLEDVTKGALFFHTTQTQPGWKGVIKTVRIEDHVFYKRK